MREVSSQSNSSAGVQISRGQLLLLALLILPFAGGMGLIGLLVMHFLTGRSFAFDAATSHGISDRNLSRLGGLGIGLTVLIYYAFQMIGEAFGSSLFYFDLKGLPILALAGGCFALVGFLDDIQRVTSPLVRLWLMFSVALLFLVIQPSLLPTKVLTLLPFEVPHLVFVLVAALVLVGFVNASNMSDGANGLVPVIFLNFFLVGLSLESDAFLVVLSMALLTFTLINLVSGRLILGDSGAYGLSAIVCLVAYDLYNTSAVSLGFLAVTLAYPCIEMLRVLVMRIVEGRSPISAGNDHLHNKLNAVLKNRFKSKILANSLTGVFLALVTISGVLVLVVTEEVGNDKLGFSIFAIQALIYLLLAKMLKDKTSV